MVVRGAMCLPCILVRDGSRARLPGELLLMEPATDVQRFQEVV